MGGAGDKAKVLGTIIGIGGAMLLTFFKGVEIDIWSFHINIMHPHSHHYQNGSVLAPTTLPHAHHSSTEHRLLGAFCAIASCFSYSLWLIIQVRN